MHQTTAASAVAVLSGATAQFIIVTPAIAEEWLKSNTDNRKVRVIRVAAYARDLRSKGWFQTGETISFGEDGTLLNGQHRLLAVVETGIPIELLVVFGVERKAQDVMDSGAGRTCADQLARAGEINTPSLSAALNQVVRWDMGQRGVMNGYNTPTKHEMIAALEKHPRIRESAAFAMTHAKGARLTSGQMTFIHWLLTGVDPGAADHFLTRLSDGVGLERTSPIYVLRDRLITAKEEAAKTKSDVGTGTVFKWSVWCWNKYRLGKEMGILRPPEGPIPEPI